MKKYIKSFLRSIAKRNIFLRKTMRRISFLYKQKRFKWNTKGIAVNEKKVLFNAFNGKSYTCTPRAVYEYMLSDSRFDDYEFVWVAERFEDFEFLLKNRDTTIVKNRSKEYEKALASSKYWFCNYRLYDYVIPKEDQVYVQCWHGTPLKRLGFDLINSDNAMNSYEEICFMYGHDASRFKYILSPSRFASEKFATAWNLVETNQTDKIIEVGYPRNDFLMKHTEADIQRIKNLLGISADKKVLLYAPTWRDNQHSSDVGYTYDNPVDFDKMRESLKEDWVILFRAHYLVANSFDFKKYEGFVYNVSEYGDINDLYITADVLMTDYSSVFFDFANLKKPIIFYMYDKYLYENNLRGFYVDLNELPGPIVEKEDEMIEKIGSVDEWFKYDDCYKAFNEKFNYLDDGQASKRLVDIVIN